MRFNIILKQLPLISNNSMVLTDTKKSCDTINYITALKYNDKLLKARALVSSS